MQRTLVTVAKQVYTIFSSVSSAEIEELVYALCQGIVASSSRISESPTGEVLHNQLSSARKVPADGSMNKIVTMPRRRAHPNVQSQVASSRSKGKHFIISNST
jgi:hypothetical protein